MRTCKTLPWVLALVVSTLNAQGARPESATGGPVDWIYVVDTSLTMLGRGKAEGKDIFSDVKSVMLDFLAHDVQVGDTVRLISFDGDTMVGEQVFIGSESAKDKVRERVQGLDARGQHTYIAKAVQETTGIVASQQVTEGRTSIAIIFTDGINEPPATAVATIDLTQALRGFPRSNAFFYFINLGTTDATNDLNNAFIAAGLGDSVRQHPGGLRLQSVKIPKLPEPLLLNVRVLPAPIAQPNVPVTWEPFEVSTNRPVDSIAIEAHAPAGVVVDAIAPLRDNNRRPRVTLTAPRAFTDRDLPVQFVLRPAEDGAATVEVTSRLSLHAPTLLERFGWLLWTLGSLLIAAAGGWAGFRWWTTPLLEGTLLMRLDGRTEAINLRRLNVTHVVVGRGGQMLIGERGFQFAITAEGTRGRLGRITATLREGTGSLHGLPLRIGEARPMRHGDAFEFERGLASGAVATHVTITYENFRLQQSHSSPTR